MTGLVHCDKCGFGMMVHAVRGNEFLICSVCLGCFLI